RQLALRGGAPNGLAGQKDRGPKEDEGKAGDPDARTRRDGTRSLAGPATPARPGVEPAAGCLPGGDRSVRSGRQDPQGSRTSARPAGRHGSQSAGTGADHAGETTRPPRSGGIGRDVDGGVSTGSSGVRAGFGGVEYDQGRKPVGGRPSGGHGGD